MRTRRVRDHRWRGVAAILVAGAIASGCSVAASPSPQATSTSPIDATASPGPIASATDAPPTTASAVTASRDGLTLSVVPDRTTVGPGEVVTFTATLTNDSAKTVDYGSSTCPGAASGSVDLPLPAGPAGKDWTGIKGQFKDYVLTTGAGPGGVPALDPLRVEMRTAACPGDPSFEPVALRPGESVTNTLTWRPELVAGVDALGGTVPFVVSAGYTEHHDEPTPAPTDPGGPMPSRQSLFEQVQVSGEVTVEPGDQRLKSPGQVIDALLADKAFSKWLAKEPKRTWSNTNLFLLSWPKHEGIIPKGPSWEIDLFREVGVPRQWAIAFVDPFDATVRSVTYCNVPCDR
jgi:hypothetical protein